jgi:hypothetical protein
LTKNFDRSGGRATTVLYGVADRPSRFEVDAAAWAAVLAIEKARRGIYNL